MLISLTNTKKEKEHFAEDPVLNVELVKYPRNQISNISGVKSINGYYYQTFSSTDGNYTIAYSTIWGYNWYNLELLFNTDISFSFIFL